MLRTVWDTIAGGLELLRLGFLSRFRFRGVYWSWRMHTAFGRGLPASRWEVVRAAIDYGRWIHAIRRLR